MHIKEHKKRRIGEFSPMRQLFAGAWMCAAVLRWADAGMLFKNSAEIVGIWKAAHLGHCADGITFGIQQITGILNLFGGDIAVWRHPEVFDKYL